MLGAPGTRQFARWVDVKAGQIIFTVALIMIGVCRTLVMGFGAVEVLREYSPTILAFNSSSATLFPACYFGQSSPHIVLELTNMIGDAGGAAELASEHPGMFGTSTCHSRAFVLSNVTWKFGMFVGPLLSGFLTEEIGYYFMDLILGKHIPSIHFCHGSAVTVES
jgi:hypothetical protein